MISVYQLKPKFQALLRPVLGVLHQHNIRPNQITWCSIFWSALIGGSLLLLPTWYGWWWTLPIGLLIRMALNALDGMLAKRYQLQSKRGEILNEMGDVLSDILVGLPLLYLFPEATLVLVLFLLLGVVNEFAGLLVKAIGHERRYDGPMGKSDRALLLGLLGITGFFWDDIAQIVPYLFGIASCLLVVSTYKRLNSEW